MTGVDLSDECHIMYNSVNQVTHIPTSQQSLAFVATEMKKNAMKPHDTLCKQLLFA